MSSDSDSSSRGGADHRSFGEITRDLVEDLYKRRQPLPSLDAIYFIQPTQENVHIFMSDMSGKHPLYKKAYIFFSSPVQKELVDQIKHNSRVLTRVGALSEMNLEYFAIDSQGFVTDHDKALEELFTESVEGSMKYNSCINTMASRIATVFASMRIADKLFEIIKQQNLKDVGQLEQDLVFGDAGTKELIDFFRTRRDISRENKLRLLMVYAAINPEKIQSDKGGKLMQLRAAHKLSSKLKRDIILGSSSLDDPPKFITKLKMLSTKELTLDDLQI
ncbi:hypothetical protein ACQ4PT_050756 [Festuca glaucescens]